MALPKLTRLELQVMQALWTRGASSVRDILETFPRARRPAFTTVQTTVYRLQAKGALRCVKRTGNANIFEAAVSREDAYNRLIDDLLAVFGGRGRPVMARLLESGTLTLEDIRDAEQALRRAAKKERPK